jgi:imidazole glycerol-phosphate synthase subunit HisF
MNIRIIPRLDIKGPNLVKGIHLEGLRVLGKPEDFARYYYENGADELMFMDVVASLFERNSLQDIITKVAREIFIPLTVGGGLRSIDDIKEVLRAGADKVAINTAGIKDPDFIKKASREFGSSTIVVAVEAIKEPDGRHLVYTDNAREYTGVVLEDWVQLIQEKGAGEIVLTSVDREGTGDGVDEELIKKISDNVSVPLIIHGGVGSPNDVETAVKLGADALAIASVFHYDFLANNTFKESLGSEEGNFEFLKKGQNFSKIDPCSISEVKEFLRSNNINCRIVN